MNTEQVSFSNIISNLVCGIGGTLSISEDRCLWAFGENIKGTLGMDPFHQIIFPTKVPYLQDIKMVSCGAFHTICIDNDGNTYSFGDNEFGQLGIGIKKTKLIFTHIPQKLELPPINYISCGYQFTVCKTIDGYIYSFGYNCEGQLGIGEDFLLSPIPILIPGISDVELVECGEDYAICKLYSGICYSWGSNSNGELGQGHTIGCNKPILCENWPDNILSIKCGAYSSLLLTVYGYVYSFGQAIFTGHSTSEEFIHISVPTLIKDIPLIKRIECGCEHSMCIDINDNLWVFGDNGYGQLGLGDKLYNEEDAIHYKPILNPFFTNIIDISSGGNHTFVKTIKNEIYSFGVNNVAQFGIETNTKFHKKPIQIFKEKEEYG